VREESCCFVSGAPTFDVFCPYISPKRNLFKFAILLYTLVCKLLSAEEPPLSRLAVFEGSFKPPASSTLYRAKVKTDKK